jgi:hypothetical protein
LRRRAHVALAYTGKITGVLAVFKTAKAADKALSEQPADGKEYRLRPWSTPIKTTNQPQFLIKDANAPQ